MPSKGDGGDSSIYLGKSLFQLKHSRGKGLKLHQDKFRMGGTF